MDTIYFKKGDDIIKEGAIGNCAYIIEQGAVEVSKLAPHGEKQVLGVLERSEIFGEMALIDGLPRSASVTALENCVVSVCSKETFNYLADHNPESLIPIFKVLVRRLRSTLFLMENLQKKYFNDSGDEGSNVIYRAMVAARSESIKIESFPAKIQKHTANASVIEHHNLNESTLSETTTAFPTSDSQTPEITSTTLQEMEKKALIKAFKKAGGNVERIARLLGISRATCYRKIKKYQIEQG
jgi:CRP/FNR family transcriptional regulator, cyclic AMP receptor protein